MRIISLVPSITETLFDFGLSSDEIIGRTKFCIHPNVCVPQVEIIGGTKTLNIEKIAHLKPDLIIANKEENEKNQVEELMRTFKVWVTDVENVDDNRTFLQEMGKITNRTAIANEFISKIEAIFDAELVQNNKKVAYLIWKNPYMTVGADTFINDVLEKLGFSNLFGDRQRYPVVEIEDLKEADLIFLSSEPFPFKQKHIDELKQYLPHQKFVLVDGEAFSWFGSHLAKKHQYLRNINEEWN